MPSSKDPHIKKAKHVHFTGIKGVGMTAAALCVKDLDIPISGTDVEDDFITKEVLEENAIPINYEFSAENIHKDTDLVVYTGAHGGPTNPQVIAAQDNNIRTMSHALAVAELMEDKTGISVCGVGGKTSTSSMMANILDYAAKKPSFLIGVGKILNIQVPGRYDAGEYFIAEADEYAIAPGTDNSPRFLTQSPKYIISTNIKHDHPDIYKDIDATKKAYYTFFQKIPKDGLLICNSDDPNTRELDLSNIPHITYGTSANADWWVSENSIQDQKNLVTFKSKDEEIQLTLSVPGKFNALNALAAFVMSQMLGIDKQTAIEGLQLFRGSLRRFEKVGEFEGIPMFDDYAHHPTQIAATIKATKEWLPLHSLTIIFQPHTYTRTKTLFTEFAKAFSGADRVIITDIYASKREAPDTSVSGESLAKETQKYHPNALYVPYSELVEFLRVNHAQNDAFMTMGAGDIYQIHEQLISSS